MRPHTLSVLTASLMLLTARPLPGQHAPDSPEAAAEALVFSLRDADWATMATQMHPDALRELRGFLDPLFHMPEHAAEFRRAFLAVESGEEARQLSDEEVFARLVRFAMTQDPEMIPSMQTATMDVLGHVMEGDTAHVVSRVTVSYQSIEVSKMEVSSFRRANGQWRGLLTGDLSALAKAIRDAVGGREP